MTTNIDDITVDKTLDTSNQPCPLPLLKTKLALHSLSSGQILRVLATDRGSLQDFPVFARTSGHQLLLSEESNGLCIHILRKQQI